jgi:hypothetical protein
MHGQQADLSTRVSRARLRLCARGWGSDPICLAGNQVIRIAFQARIAIDDDIAMRAGVASEQNQRELRDGVACCWISSQAIRSNDCVVLSGDEVVRLVLEGRIAGNNRLPIDLCIPHQEGYRPALARCRRAW